jgi:hypothetical protein
VENTKKGLVDNDRRVFEAFSESFADIEQSVRTSQLQMPAYARIQEEVVRAVEKGHLMVEVVNSDNEVEKLLDDFGQLRLRTPLNLFIGGQVLDRGITVRNLVGFYYGRSPQTMQQDTVLQHSRMYGARPRADLAVTRFYTSAHNYDVMRRIHQFDAALRDAFERGAHGRGVAFLHRDTSNRLVPCSPNKLLASRVFSIRPGGRLLPVGFQSRSTLSAQESVAAIDRLVPPPCIDTNHPARVPLDKAISILEAAERTMEFESGYEWDWRAFKATLEYYSQMAKNEGDQAKVLLMAETGRDISRIRSGGRHSNAPDTKQHIRVALREATELPMLLLLRQNGSAEKGWGGTPFWWPVLIAPIKALPAVYSADYIQ